LVYLFDFNLCSVTMFGDVIRVVELLRVNRRVTSRSKKSVNGAK